MKTFIPVIMLAILFSACKLNKISSIKARVNNNTSLKTGGISVICRDQVFRKGGSTWGLLGAPKSKLPPVLLKEIVREYPLSKTGYYHVEARRKLLSKSKFQRRKLSLKIDAEMLPSDNEFDFPLYFDEDVTLDSFCIYVGKSPVNINTNKIYVELYEYMDNIEWNGAEFTVNYNLSEYENPGTYYFERHYYEVLNRDYAFITDSSLVTKKTYSHNSFIVFPGELGNKNLSEYINVEVRFPDGSLVSGKSVKEINSTDDISRAVQVDFYFNQ